MLSGALVQISRFGEAFQIGTGAHLNNPAVFGASGWLDFDVLSQPTDGPVLNGNTAHGDFNFELPVGPGLLDVPSCAEICEGGSVELFAFGFSGAAPYGFEWSNGSTGASISVSPAASTTYSVNITDANGCTATATIDVTVNGAPMISCSPENGACGAFGSASVTASGGSGTYSYSWSNGETSASITDLASGSYTVTVTDTETGCSDECTVVINNTPAIVADCSSTDGECGALGSASVTASGGSNSYSYAWSNGASGAMVTDLASGSYTVTVTDTETGCSDECMVVIDNTPALTVSCSDGGAVCDGESNGTASAVAEGGTGDYSYAWSNGATTASISGLAAGTYTVTVTDGAGCSASCSVTVGTLVSPIVDIACVDDPALFFDGGGIADNTINCSSGTYAFWSNTLVNAYTSQKLWTIADGSFVENDGGSAVFTGTVTNKSDADLSFELSVVFDGRTLTAPAGSPKENSVCVGDIDNTDWYYYTSTTGTLIGIGDLDGAVVNISRFGEAFQIGTGANLNQELEYGASGWLEYDIISQPSTGPMLNASSGHGDFNFSLPGGPGLLDIPTCTTVCEGEDVTLSAIALAGDGAYSYLWSNGATTPTITLSPATAGTYSVTVASNGCTATATIDVTVNGAPMISCFATDACNGAGSATADVTGGTEPYSYSWTDADDNSIEGNSTISNLEAGTYFIIVTDANGCTAACNVDVTSSEAPDVAITCEDFQPLVSSYGFSDYTRTCGEVGIAFNSLWTSTSFNDIIPASCGADRPRWAILDNTSFIENFDGTGQLTMTVVSKCDENLILDVLLNLSGRTFTTPAGSPVFGTSANCVDENSDTSDWYYYTGVTGSITGLSDLDGLLISLTETGGAFQIGTGANQNNEFGPGASTWLLPTILSQPNNGSEVTLTPHFDVTIDLDQPVLQFEPGDCLTICEGESALLVANSSDPASTYLWSTGETTQTISANPAVTSSYSVTVTGGNGCSTVTEITVTVEDCAPEFDCPVLEANNGDACMTGDGLTGQLIDCTCISEIVMGCTNVDACNFNETATDNDESCVFATEVCEVCDGDEVALLDADGDGVCDGDEIAGCQDETACNFNAAATDDDGSCALATEPCEVCDGDAVVDLDEDGDGVCDADEIEGCQDATACNFNPAATDDDGSCISVDGICQTCVDGVIVDNDADDDGICDADETAGCTDMAACNFNAAATDDDGSCAFATEPCEACVGNGVLILDEDGDGVCDADEIEGCQDATACNFNPAATDDDGSCISVDGICQTCVDGVIVDNDADDDGICDADETAGCTDMAACNFNAAATDDDGSCAFATEPCEACVGNGVLILDEDGDGVCDADEIEGCQDATACNFNPAATDDDGSCISVDGICQTCVDGVIVDNDADDDGICDADETAGCTDMAACNFNAAATDDDGSCAFATEPCEACVGNGVLILDEDGDGVCDADEIEGCQDATACNFNPAATDDDGSCISVDGICQTCVDGVIVDNDADDDGICDADETAGCTDMAACNFNAAATDDDGSCAFATEPCEACVGNGVLILDEDGDGVCDADEIEGCQDDAACNFNPAATDDDGSCISVDGICQTCVDGVIVDNDADDDGICDADETAGCTDMAACNFNAAATDDDGSCAFATEPCEACVGNGVLILDEDGDGVCDADEIAGCQDDTACNFNPAATDDDGSCISVDGICQTCADGVIVDNDADNDGICDADETAGCTDMAACNFNAAATDDDGSCISVDGICQTCIDGVIVNNDADNDGVCTADDCDDNDPDILGTGSTCDDGDAATENDVYTADCDCEGTIPTPANDLCADAIPVLCGQTVSGTNVNATNNGNPAAPNCGPAIGSFGVWYSFEGDGSIVTVSTCSPSTDFDTKLNVYSGACGGFTCVGGADDSSGPDCQIGGFNRKSTVEFTSEEGTTYYIIVSGFSTAAGNFDLSISCEDPPLCVAPSTLNTTTTETCANGTGTFDVSISLSQDGSEGTYVITNNIDDQTASIALDGTATFTFPSGTDAAIFATNEAFSECVTATTVTFTCPPAAPANDECVGAIALACGTPLEGQTFVSATQSIDDACSGLGTADVWYTFEADGSSTYTISESSSADVVVNLYSGSCDGLTEIGSCQDSPENFTVTEAGTYYFRIRPYFISGTTHSVLLTCVAPPECESPILTIQAIDIDGNGLVDCLNSDGDFYVLASLSGGNGNDSYEVTINNGDSESIASNGSFTFGPFDAGIAISADAIGTDDGDCGASATIDSPEVCSPSSACGIYSDSPNSPIGPNAGFVDNIITVTGTAGQIISDLNVALKGSHSFLADVDVTLISPSGTAVQLFTDICSAGENFDVLLDDSAGAITCITGSIPVLFGTYAPESPALLSIFNGQGFDGNWILRVADDAVGDGGVFETWCLLPTLEMGEPIVLGCVDMDACNFNGNATTDDGSCFFEGDACVTTSGADGLFQDCECIIPAPANDLIAGAIEIECGGVASGSTTNATNGDNPGSCLTAPGNKGVWYSFFGNGEEVTAGLCNSTYDTKINVYSGSIGDLECVVGNDDGCDLQSIVNFNAAEGVTYYIYVNGFSTNSGAYTLTVDCIEALPLALSQNITVELDENGLVNISPDDVDAGSNAPQGLASKTVDITEFDCSHVGDNMVTLTVTDINGNASSCEAMVTIIDTTAPSVVCQDATISLNSNGEATLHLFQIDGGCSDNCQIETFSIDKTSFSCEDVGVHVVSLSVTDMYGNTSVATSNVTVQYNQTPWVLCEDVALTLDNTGYAELTSDVIEAQLVDICGYSSMSMSGAQFDFDCSSEGSSYPVVVTMTYQDGSSLSCTKMIEVLPGADQDGDLISDICDSCTGTDASGDTDNDGVCDSNDQCPGFNDMAALTEDCKQVSLNGKSLNANQPVMFCVAVANSGNTITASNGSTIRLSGSGTVALTLSAGAKLEIVDNANITFSNLTINPGAEGILIYPGVVASYNQTLTANTNIVNCGTLNVKYLNLSTGKLFTNNGELNVMGSGAVSYAHGQIKNYGSVNTAGTLHITSTGELMNYCQVQVTGNLYVENAVENHSFMEVGEWTCIYPGTQITFMNEAFMHTRSVLLYGGFKGQNTTSVIMVDENTIIFNSGVISGNLAYCDESGIEYDDAPQCFQNGAEPMCGFGIAASGCNPGFDPGVLASKVNTAKDKDIFNMEDISHLLVGSVQNELVAIEISLSPNPAQAQSVVSFVPVKDGRVKIDLYDLNGKLVDVRFEGDLFKNIPFQTTLSLESLANGVYFVHVNDGADVQTLKVVVAK